MTTKLLISLSARDTFEVTVEIPHQYRDPPRRTSPTKLRFPSMSDSQARSSARYSVALDIVGDENKIVEIRKIINELNVLKVRNITKEANDASEYRKASGR